MRGVVGWSGRWDEATLEVRGRVGRVNLEEDAQWGVVQWSLPERLLELRKEHGGMQKMSVQHGQYESVYGCTLSSELHIYKSLSICSVQQIEVSD